MTARIADLTAVERAARRLRSRLAEIEYCRRALDDEIALAVRAGAHVADVAQLSRQTVYDAMARTSERVPDADNVDSG